MNWFIFVLGVVLISVVVCEQYTDRYDNINVDEILANRRLLMPYLKCLLDQGRCTPEGKEIKLHVKDAMQNSCEKCTDVQKKIARKVVKHIREHENETWEQVRAKYDPGDKYLEQYEAFLSADDE